MEESELLYGDLEATGLSEELKRKQKENDRLRKEKNEIESELKTLGIR
jgi:cell division protein FtsB